MTTTKNPYPTGSARWRAWQLQHPQHSNALTHIKNALTHNPSDTAMAVLNRLHPDGLPVNPNAPNAHPPKQPLHPIVYNPRDNHPTAQNQLRDYPQGRAILKQRNHIANMRAFLINKGYKLPKVSDPNTMDKYLRDAAADFRGNRNASNWNASHGFSASSPGQGSLVNVSKGHGSSKGNGSSTGPNAKSVISGLGNPDVNQLIDPSMAINGANLIDTSLAGHMAGLEYDPQIQDTKMQIERSPLDLQQHLHDISTWYGTVDKALGTARTRNGEAAKTASDQTGKIAQGILASMGGSAAAGAGMVGAQGAADAALRSELGANEQQYQNDLAPLFASESAGAKGNELARGEKLAQDLAAQLGSLQGQRGQQEAQYRYQILGDNNTTRNNRADRALNIATANNGVRQQNLTNRQQAQALALTAALNNAQIKSYTNSTTGDPFIPWMKMNPAQRAALINGGMANVLDANNGLQGNNPNQSRGKVLNYLAAQGYQGALHPGTAPYNSMSSLIDLAIQHALGQSKSNAATIAAANG